MRKFYTAEAVTEGHPDKVCDQIADAILDVCLKNDADSKVACEVLATKGTIIVAGEITSAYEPDVFGVIKKVLSEVGYSSEGIAMDPALKTPDMERYVRLRSLGKGYGEAEIQEKILRPKIQQVYGKTQVKFPKRKLTGLQKLYFSYLYRMGVLQQKPKRISYAVRSDIRKLDLRIRQMEFLQKEGITTREELAAYRKPLEEQVLSLMKERRTLYRKEPGSMRLQEINGELKELRKKIRLSQQIEIQSKEMEERLKRAKEQEQVQESSGKQRREEERKR